jgi:hypothetical protein
MASPRFYRILLLDLSYILIEELRTDSINESHEGQLWARSRVKKRAYSNIYTCITYL